jgi:hypothetical protein
MHPIFKEVFIFPSCLLQKISGVFDERYQQTFEASEGKNVHYSNLHRLKAVIVGTNVH